MLNSPGHTGEACTGSRCTEVLRSSITARRVPLLVTIACVTGNEEAGLTIYDVNQSKMGRISSIED